MPVAAPRSGADITVKGRVTDADTKEPLVGCNVVVKGTQKGTNTDANGNFSIVVSDEKAVLVIGFIGYEKQEIAVGCLLYTSRCV